jgi:hypothetical protein
MPDPILMLTASAVAAIVSGVMVLIGGWPWRAPRRGRLDAAWVVGQGTGWVAGCWLLGVRPRWPIHEDLDRLLIIVLPAVLLVELAGLSSKVPRWLVWVGRLIVVAGVGRVLLQGTSYLAGPAKSTAWSSTQTWSILVSMAMALGAIWWLVAQLARREPGLSLWICLAGTCAGAGLVVMLSGYATGGQIGLPLAGALLGAAMAAFVLTRSSRGSSHVGVAIIGLFSLLMIGHFFGELTWIYATVLLLAPLLAWLPEAPPLCKLRPWARGLVRVVSVAVVVVGVVIHAQRKFVEAFQTPSGASPSEPTAQDYLDFGR